jgi:hypothetical protein
MSEPSELKVGIRLRKGLQKSLTGWFSFERLASAQHGSLIVRLMMAANDMNLANWSLIGWHEPQPGMRRHMQQGAIQYFIRLQCGHLREAMKLITEIRNDANMINRLKKSSAEARRAFATLEDCLPGGANHDEYEKLVGRMRNKMAFHYDPVQVAKALQRLADGNRVEKITLGMDIFLGRFNLADTLMSTIFTREIMGVPAGDNPSREFDRVRAFIDDLCVSYLRFVNEFSVNYLRDYAST